MGRLIERLSRRRAKGPLLSVIVPIYNVEDYLDACLDSIRRQRYGPVEIVIVDDGSPDRSHDIAVRHAGKDDRIRIVRRPNGGLSAARNTGVEAATGEFLTFVDSDDTVTADGFADAMSSLTQTGSDVAVLGYGRIRGGKEANAAAWIRALHRTEQRSVTLADVPDVMVNATAWGKVIRRSFYDAQQLSFVEGVIYEDQAFTAQMYAAARSIDILTTVGYNWRVNDTSISQGHVTVDNLTARLNAADDSLAALDGHAARPARALQLLRHNMPNSVLKLERADDPYLDVLIERLPGIVDAAPAEQYAATVPAQFRVLNELIRHGDRERIWAYVAAEGMQVEMHPSGLEEAGFVAYLPGWGSDPVPAAAYVLTAEQTVLKTRLLGGHQVGRGEFTIDVQAWFQNVGHDSALSATVIAEGVPLEVDVSAGEDVIVSSRQGAERRYRGSGFTLNVHQGDTKLPKTLDIEITLAAGPFTATRRWREFASKRIQTM